jgi:hypothetical protein
MEDEARASETRFVEYVESLAEVLGYVDRSGPLKDYCTGLLLPGERKSVEPIAAIVAPSRVSAEHQSLLHSSGSRPGRTRACWPRCESSSCHDLRLARRHLGFVLRHLARMLLGQPFVDRGRKQIPRVPIDRPEIAHAAQFVVGPRISARILRRRAAARPPQTALVQLSPTGC